MLLLKLVMCHHYSQRFQQQVNAARMEGTFFFNRFALRFAVFSSSACCRAACLACRNTSGVTTIRCCKVLPFGAASAHENENCGDCRSSSCAPITSNAASKSFCLASSSIRSWRIISRLRACNPAKGWIVCLYKYMQEVARLDISLLTQDEATTHHSVHMELSTSRSSVASHDLTDPGWHLLCDELELLLELCCLCRSRQSITT